MLHKSLILIHVCLCFLITESCSQEFSIMTFNIRFDDPHDPVNGWYLRKDDILEMLDEQKPAFLGIQEGLANQVEFLDSALVNYHFIGGGRDDGERRGEYSALYYDTTLFKLDWSATFWLSETPEKPSVGWDAMLNRICTFGLFTHIKTDKQLWVFNTHFDHVGLLARKNSAHVILEHMKSLRPMVNVPVVLMGDFNAMPEEEPIQILSREMHDTFVLSPKQSIGPVGTFNRFEENPALERRIDYVFVKNLDVIDYRHLSDKTSKGRWLSDHLPVVVKLSFQ